MLSALTERNNEEINFPIRQIQNLTWWKNANHRRKCCKHNSLNFLSIWLTDPSFSLWFFFCPQIGVRCFEEWVCAIRVFSVTQTHTLLLFKGHITSNKKSYWEMFENPALLNSYIPNELQIEVRICVICFLAFWQLFSTLQSQSTDIHTFV